MIVASRDMGPRSTVHEPRDDNTVHLLQSALLKSLGAVSEAFLLVPSRDPGAQLFSIANQHSRI